MKDIKPLPDPGSLRIRPYLPRQPPDSAQGSGSKQRATATTSTMWGTLVTHFVLLARPRPDCPICPSPAPLPPTHLHHRPAPPRLFGAATVRRLSVALTSPQLQPRARLRTPATLRCRIRLTVSNLLRSRCAVFVWFLVACSKSIVHRSNAFVYRFDALAQGICIVRTPTEDLIRGTRQWTKHLNS